MFTPLLVLLVGTFLGILIILFYQLATLPKMSVSIA